VVSTGLQPFGEPPHQVSLAVGGTAAYQYETPSFGLVFIQEELPRPITHTFTPTETFMEFSVSIPGSFPFVDGLRALTIEAKDLRDGTQPIQFELVLPCCHYRWATSPEKEGGMKEVLGLRWRNATLHGMTFANYNRTSDIQSSSGFVAAATKFSDQFLSLNLTSPQRLLITLHPRKDLRHSANL